MARANVSYHVFVWWMRREPRSAWSLPGSRSLTYGSYGISEPAQEPEPEDNSPEFSVRGWTTQDILSLKPPLSSRRSLTRIDLNSNNIWDRGAQAVADAIRACPQLAIVELENNTIGATGAVLLSFIYSCTQLLSGCFRVSSLAPERWVSHDQRFFTALPFFWTGWISVITIIPSG